MPNDFPGRIGQMWRCYVDLLTGEWFLSYVDGTLSMIPQVTHSLYMKVCDEGHYTFFDEGMKSVGEVVEDYVPGFFPGEHYGDYLIFEFDAGRITNWKINQYDWDEFWKTRPALSQPKEGRL